MKNKELIVEKRRELCAAFRKIRTEKGQTIEQVADDLGLVKQTVGKIERGQWSVGIDQILQLCDYYGVDIEVKGLQR